MVLHSLRGDALGGSVEEMTPRQRQLAGLKPIKPGEVRNPTGRNQYSGRQAFLAHLEKLLTDRDNNLAKELALQLAEFAAGHAGEAWEQRQAREMVYPRLLPDVRVGIDAHVDGDITVSVEDRDAAKERLIKLMGRKAG